MEFEKTFSTEEKCLDYFIKLRWQNGYKCISCNSSEYWVASRKRLKCKSCGHTITITRGTLFEQSNKPITIWFRAIWWMIAQKNGVSAVGLQSILGLGGYKTAWIWLHKLRAMMILPERKKLSGTVEVDETLVGGYAEGKRGRGAENKSLVVIAVEVLAKGTGRMRMEQIGEATRIELEKFIGNNVEEGTTIITDGWRGYLNVNKLKYTHQIHKQNAVLNEEEMLPNVHRVASLLKRWLMGTHQNYVSKDRLQSYLNEYTFRYNRRKSNSRGLLFYRILEHAVRHPPILERTVLAKKNIKTKS